MLRAVRCLPEQNVLRAALFARPASPDTWSARSNSTQFHLCPPVATESQARPGFQTGRLGSLDLCVLEIEDVWASLSQFATGLACTILVLAKMCGPGLTFLGQDIWACLVRTGS